MQQELVVSLANGDRLKPVISSPPFAAPDFRPYLSNGGDYLGLYPSPIFSLSPNESSLGPATAPSVSLTPSSTTSFDDDEGHNATENRLYLARLTLQYQEIAERFALCLAHLQDAAEEAEALRGENAQLRIANAELTNRLGLLPGVKQNGQVASPTEAIVEELRRLQLAGDPPVPQASPRSVLGMQENQFARRGAEERIPLPKSISVRSSGYLKLNPGAAAGSTSNQNGRLRVSTPVIVGSQRVYVGANVGKEVGEGGGTGAAGEEALEFEVYNQGMFKTELCNKWEKTGECPYGDHCQFAHGIGELRPVIRHPRYKTEVCRMVLSGESCPYGHRCHFRHILSPNDRLLPATHL